MSSEPNAATRMVLVTANVGTIFENLNEMLDIWLNEITNKISELQPEFIALHLQEVGGKNYKQSMQSVDIFYKKFFNNTIIRAYNRYLVLIDSDFTDDLTFTSLNSIYLIHKQLADVELYNFEDKSLVAISSLIGFFIRKDSKRAYSKNIINLLNIHLFHDASNLIALNSSPSIYSEYRRKALNYTLDVVNKNKSSKETAEQQAFAIFGDFNFRLDMRPLVNNYTLNTTQSAEFKDENNRLLKIIFNDAQNKELFTIEEKKFKWHAESNKIKDELANLLKFDKELLMHTKELVELDIKFPPSYPFMEDLINYEQYMESRCPAWCDRVLMSQGLSSSLNAESQVYDMIGKQACMGDHKPVYLFYSVNSTTHNNSYTINNNNSEPVTNSSNNNNDSNLNYVYINNNLSSLDKLNTDLHDYAWFNNISQLQHSIKFPFEFYLPNLNLSHSSKQQQQQQQQQHSHLKHKPSLNKSSEFRVKLKQEINLFDLVKSIATLLKQETSNPKENDSLYYVKFFTQALNANFFKLKYLISSLNDQAALLSEMLDTTKQQQQQGDQATSDFNNNNTQLGDFNLDELTSSNAFEVSFATLLILNEARAFLSQTSTLEVFKSLVEKHTSSKKLSIYSNFFH